MKKMILTLLAAMLAVMMMAHAAQAETADIYELMERVDALETLVGDLQAEVYGLPYSINEHEPEPGPGTAVAPMFPSFFGKQYKIVAGIIRLPLSGPWEVLEDGAHGALGISGISASSDRVTVWFDFEASKMITFLVVPDEYFTKIGVSGGASVAKNRAEIFFNRRPNTGYADPMTLRSAYGNFWIFGVFETGS